MQYHVIFNDNFESINTPSKTKEIDNWTTIHKRNIKGSTPIKTEFCSYQNFFKEQTSPLPDRAHKVPNSDTSTKERP